MTRSSMVRILAAFALVAVTLAACEDEPAPATDPCLDNPGLAICLDGFGTVDVAKPDGATTDAPGGDAPGADAGSDAGVDSGGGDAPVTDAPPADAPSNDTPQPDAPVNDTAPSDNGPTDAQPDVCTPNCAGKVCGTDGCGGTCGAGCAAQEACVSGVCVDSTGAGDSCDLILQCAADCEDGACQQACIAAGSTLGQAEFGVYAQCAGTCQDQLCLISNGCADEAAQCLLATTGTGTCAALIGCLGGCAQDNLPCAVACREQATAQAQALEIEMNWCLLDACPNGDQPCVQAAAGGACASYVNACQAN